MNVRVLSYNVLSTRLAAASHYPVLNPEHLLAENRLPVILQKLEAEIKGNPENTIVCLQEVSYEWAGAFHSFFASKGWHLVTGLYGKKFNGYMGVALAWPTAGFDTVDVDICRLAETREQGWPPRPESPSFVAGLMNGLSSWVGSTMAQLGWKSNSEEGPPDHWTLSENRFNVLLTATLREKKTGKAFSIGNYHMPCAYYCPMAMTLHSDLCARRLQSIAEKNDIPYILAGDFNIKPNEAVYEFLTTGQLEESSPFYPSPKNGMVWSPTSKAMRSAYAVKNGKEPDFTNFAQSKDSEPFIDTLDFIFLSDAWTVDNVLELPHRDDAKGPFPNLDVDEPSDHIMIAASLSC